MGHNNSKCIDICNTEWAWQYGHAVNYNDSGECIAVRWLESIDCDGNPMLHDPVQYYPCDVDPAVECVCTVDDQASNGTGGRTYTATVTATEMIVDTTDAFLIGQLNEFVTRTLNGDMYWLRLRDGSGGDIQIYGYGNGSSLSQNGTVYTLTHTVSPVGDGCDDERESAGGVIWQIVEGSVNASGDGAINSGFLSHVCTNPTTPDASITPLDPQPATGTVFCGDCPDAVVVVDEYETSLASEFLSDSSTVPTAPINTKEAVVFNHSGTWLEYTTNYGTQIAPPYGTIEFSVNDPEGQLVFISVAVLEGTFGADDRIGINYRGAF